MYIEPIRLAVVILGLVAIAVLLYWRERLRTQKRRRLEEWEARFQEPDPSVLSPEVEEEVQAAAAKLEELVGDPSVADRDKLYRRLRLAMGAPTQGHYEYAPAEVAQALVMISLEVPTAAVHDESVILLSKLRALVGAREFMPTCTSLVEAFANPRYARLQEGFSSGDMEWTELLFLLRSLPNASEKLAIDYHFDPAVLRRA